MIHVAAIYWDPNPEFFRIPYLNWPILWYSALFALGFALGFPIFVSLLTRYFRSSGPFRNEDPASLKKRATSLTDRLIVYMIVATVVGARLGHFFFYERPRDYLNRIGEIFKFPIEGLSSHGAAIAIVLALILFAYRFRQKTGGMSAVKLLDLIAVPTALAGSFIRIGNFFNQEILGTKTAVPWGVIFGHPADHSEPVPRHPVQLYEALSYLFVFLILWRLSYRPKFLNKEGRLIGLFLILVFGSRFAIEFLKLEQSRIMPQAFDLTMGQILSIPAVVAGFILYFWNRKQ